MGVWRGRGIGRWVEDGGGGEVLFRSLFIILFYPFCEKIESWTWGPNLGDWK